MASAETPSPVPAPATPGSDSSFGRIFGVLFSPKPTFEAIVRRPTWILPLILIVVVAVGVIFTFSQRVGWRNFMIRQDQQNSRTQKQMESMTEEQRENLIKRRRRWRRLFAYVSSDRGNVHRRGGGGGGADARVQFIHGTKIGFAPSLGIVSYSWVPGIIGGLLGILGSFPERSVHGGLESIWWHRTPERFCRTIRRNGW